MIYRLVYLFFTIIFTLIGTTSVLVYVYIQETYPLVICEFAMVCIFMTIVYWKDYENEKKRNTTRTQPK